MQEICQSGSEGGAEHTPSSLPLFQPGVFNPISANLLCYDIFGPEFFVLEEILIIREQNVASLLKSGKDPTWAECSAGVDEA